MTVKAEIPRLGDPIIDVGDQQGQANLEFHIFLEDLVRQIGNTGTVTVTTGSGPPGFTPVQVGNAYVDELNNNVWMATGTASSADWKQATGQGGGDLLAANNLNDVASAATARTNLDVDQAGTDNSTNVTLAGAGTYLSLVGQVLTQDPIATVGGSDTEIQYNNSGVSDGIAELTWDGTNLVFNAVNANQCIIVEGFEMGSTAQSDKCQILPVINGQDIEISCSSVGHSGFQLKDYNGTFHGWLHGSTNNIAFYSDNGNTIMWYVDKATKSFWTYHNTFDVTKTVAAASGGLTVNNTLTGSGYERVLTASDSVTSTTAALEAVGNAINTDAAKVKGYRVLNTTTGATVFASGNADGDVWHYYDSTTAHTPI